MPTPEKEALEPNLREEFNPAEADFGYRAPLTPHLARPASMLKSWPELVNKRKPEVRWDQRTSIRSYKDGLHLIKVPNHPCDKLLCAMTVKTAVIAAAGLGTRFLPISKAIPKELLPLIDRPLIQYAVEQAVDAGIDRVIIVTPPDSHFIKTYFEPSPKLEKALATRGNEKLSEIQRISRLIHPIIVHQDAPGGLGQAILCAKKAVGDHPFVVYLPDDLVVNSPSLTHQLLNIFDSYGPVIAVEKITPDKTNAYGIVSGRQIENRLLLIDDVIEKPSPDSAPSNLGIVGQYVLAPSIFECLESLSPGVLGEIQLTDGISMLARETKMYAYEFEGKRYDCGTPLGLLRASVEQGLERTEFRQDIKRWVKQLASELDDQ